MVAKKIWTASWLLLSYSTELFRRKTPSVGKAIEAAVTVNLGMHAPKGAVASNAKMIGGMMAMAARLSWRIKAGPGAS
eukprot:5174767-Pleurochrysis_carterae.AAC.5